MEINRSEELYVVNPIVSLGLGQKGLISTKDIIQGTRILVEKPIFSVKYDNSIKKMEEDIKTKLNTLPKSERDAFAGLCNNYPEEPEYLVAIFKTNALRYNKEPLALAGVYLTVSRSNHSCLPNAHCSFRNDPDMAMALHATQDIKSGEEITISYGESPVDSKEDRNIFLKESKGFECKCQLCSSPAKIIEASDIRRKAIKALHDKKVQEKPEDILKDCGTMVENVKTEFPGWSGFLLGTILNRAFQICLAHGDMARATVLLERYYKTVVVYEGGDSTAAKTMEGWKVDLTRHPYFQALSNQWHNTVEEDIPVVSDSFEQWLYRVN